MVHKKNWVLIPGLLVGLGLAIMGCSQSDRTSSNRTDGSQPPSQTATPNPPAQSAPSSTATAPSPPSSSGSSSGG
jgi:hypothetical protein